VHPRNVGHHRSSLLGVAVVTGCFALVQFHWRSFTFCAVVPPVAPVIVLMHSANACITLSAWVMVGIYYVFVFEMDGVQMAFAFGCLDITRVSVVMFWGGEEIPPVN
jgi:hypothetical protein